MEIVFKRKDVLDIIRIYYRKFEGINVDVKECPDNNIDETFKIEYSFNKENAEALSFYVPVSKINEMIRTVLTSYGFTVDTIDINYGGKHDKVFENNEIKMQYTPYFQRVIVTCELNYLKENKVKK